MNSNVSCSRKIVDKFGMRQFFPIFPVKCLLRLRKIPMLEKYTTNRHAESTEITCCILDIGASCVIFQ